MSTHPEGPPLPSAPLAFPSQLRRSAALRAAAPRPKADLEAVLAKGIQPCRLNLNPSLCDCGRSCRNTPEHFRSNMTPRPPFCLEGGVHPTHKTAFPIAWVEIGKAYVSYHFMPVYANPKLMDGISPKLKARMQGKSCFNFKTCDEDLFTELEQLTVKRFAAFKNAPFMREAKPQKA